MAASLQPKSKKGQPDAWLWMFLDHDGKLEAVCYKAKDLKELLSNASMAKCSGSARVAFLAARYGAAVPVRSGLIDLAGRPLG